MKLNTKLLTISALFIAALMLLSPISQINTSGGGGIDNYDLDFLNSLDINNNNFVLSADQNSYPNTVSISEITSSSEGNLSIKDGNIQITTVVTVSSIDELKILSDIVNGTHTNKSQQSIQSDFSGYTVILTGNLKFNIPAKGESNFTPIGKDDSHTFKGTFDGQGHTISNLQVSGVEYAGLFGFLGKESIVKNLKMINSEISANSTNGDAYSGGITGYNDNGTITNCYNTGDVKATSTANNKWVYSGGIAGKNDKGTITNCYSIGDVESTASIRVHSGGITGYNDNGTITNCYNTGVVTADSTENKAYSGGITGSNGGIDGTITNCYNTGVVTATANNIAYSGGIAGYDSEIITNCYNTGVVKADSTNDSARSGGIAGSNSEIITNCYNTGVVTADSTENEAYSGGIAGRNYEIITNCYNSGVVSGSSNSGGIAGSNDGGIITNCYNTGVVTADSTENEAYSGGVAGHSGALGEFVGKITNCYNTGNVNAKSTISSAYSGGVVGKNDENSTVQFCYSNENSNPKLIGNNVGDDGCKTFDDSGNLSDGSKLLEALNEWVTANEQNPDKYRYWMDPFIQDEEYPVFTDWYGEAKRLNKSLEKNSNGVYVIENEHQLALIADDLNGNYALSENIDLSGYEWRPIGKDDSNQFNGTFDGQGHTISNLSVNINSKSGNVYSGLFGYLGSNATVKNLGITNSLISVTAKSTITGTGAYSGGIAGHNDGTIQNCYNTGIVTATSESGDAESGGIAGHNDGTIQNCYNTGIVTATSESGDAESGGIAGHNDDGTIENCYNTGVVTATPAYDAYSGGIAGENYGTITNCYNTGDVTATADSTSTNNDAYSGGVAGRNYQGSVTNCYNTGDVTATSTDDASSGGIVGYNYLQGSVTNCYNTGDVTATSADDAYSGGIVGENWIQEQGTIENCYNAGAVTAESTNNDAYSGGIVGYCSGTIENTFYLELDNITGFGNEQDDGKATPLNSSEMIGLKLLGGESSTYNLNVEQDQKPWSPDIFGVNDGYPILADVPTQIDSNSTNKSPQSAVYITFKDSNNVSESAQAKNYLEPFIGTNGDKVTATVKYIQNPTINITSYQWYEMNVENVVGTSSSYDILQGTYYVKVTSSDGYSYTSLTRTASNIVTVSFDSNGGSAVDEIESDYGTTIARPEDPTRTGYTFEGWCSDETLSTPYNFEDEVKSDMTLYAKWKEIKYTVKYDSNGSTSGTVPTDNKEYTINDDIKVELNEGNLAKSGHIFRGWNYTKDASSGLPSEITLTKDVIEKYINTVPNNTILNLYAVWTPIPEPIYTLCLNSNDSTLQTKRYSGTYGTEITLKSASDFGWNNECKFIEWNSKSDGSGVSYKEGDKFSLGSDVWNLYAVWSDSSYHTVSFDSNGGNNVPSQSVQDGYRASEPNAPTKQGHSFKYWSLNGSRYDFNQSVKEDITLKAEYEVISYKVTFYYNGDVYYSTQVDYNTSLGDRMPSLPSDKDSWNTSENGKGSNFTSDSLITSDISIYAVSENSITSILIIGGSAAAILAAIAAWLFMRSRYN